ncbi:MAG: hypothetical protein E6Q77_01905 [Rhizobium sp.]|nr:MAG: hypothetical protein E6Q77_01905 [Rhizobium sp.]
MSHREQMRYERQTEFFSQGLSIENFRSQNVQFIFAGHIPSQDGLMTDHTLEDIEKKLAESKGPDPSEGLRLMRAFMTIRSRHGRLQVIKLAEMLAAASPSSLTISD